MWMYVFDVSGEVVGVQLLLKGDCLTTGRGVRFGQGVIWLQHMMRGCIVTDKQEYEFQVELFSQKSATIVIVSGGGVGDLIGFRSRANSLI